MPTAKELFEQKLSGYDTLFGRVANVEQKLARLEGMGALARTAVPLMSSLLGTFIGLGLAKVFK